MLNEKHFAGGYTVKWTGGHNYFEVTDGHITRHAYGITARKAMATLQDQVSDTHQQRLAIRWIVKGILA